MDQRRLQKAAPNDPTQVKPADQNKAPERSGVRRQGRLGLAVLTIMGHGGCHGQTVVAATAMVAIPPPATLIPSPLFDFPRDFSSVFAIVLP